MSTHQRRRHARCALDGLISNTAARLTSTRDTFWRLVSTIRANSVVLRPSSGRGATDARGICQVVRACARMANCEADWCHPPETWIAPEVSPYVQFRSLVTHLFDRFCVPTFMAAVWLADDDTPWDRDLYLHLARGRSVRAFRWPVPVRLSKAAARYFMQAPDDLHPLEAMRWAQVRSLGGDSRLARLLVSRTFLVAPTGDEQFWESVIRFLINYAPIADDEIVAIVNFIHGQRFQPARQVWDPDAGDEPLDPNFSLKGRSVHKLRRYMANWRLERMAKLSIPEPMVSSSAWTPFPIGDFLHRDGDALWSIEELLSARELRVEGAIMQHCVARYIRDCARRRTSIWSMKMQQGAARQRVLTIGVLPSKTIWQAKGKKNSPPSEAARKILERWARQEGLKFERTN